MYNVSNKLDNQTEYYTTKVSGSRAEFGPNVSHYSASLCVVVIVVVASAFLSVDIADVGLFVRQI